MPKNTPTIKATLPAAMVAHVPACIAVVVAMLPASTAAFVEVIPVIAADCVASAPAMVAAWTAWAVSRPCTRSSRSFSGMEVGGLSGSVFMVGAGVPTSLPLNRVDRRLFAAGTSGPAHDAGCIGSGVGSVSDTGSRYPALAFLKAPGRTIPSATEGGSARVLDDEDRNVVLGLLSPDQGVEEGVDELGSVVVVGNFR